jgi:predicted O-methyltransferase YrrM
MMLEQLFHLERESINRGIPIIGREKGKWLYKKIQTVQPQEILELGTANGYSGIILGSSGARLLTIEHDSARAREAQQNFRTFSIQATVHVGDAVSYVRALAQDPKNKGRFGIVFIDFAKHKYLTVFADCFFLTKPGGFIIADNITMEGCKDFKDHILREKLLKTELISIQDGLSCSIVLSA